VNTVMNLGLRQMLGKSYLAVQLSASQEGLSYLELQQQYPVKPSPAISCVRVEIVSEILENLSLSPLGCRSHCNICSWFDECRVHTPC
jgi:hypothetical protein